MKLAASSGGSTPRARDAAGEDARSRSRTPRTRRSSTGARSSTPSARRCSTCRSRRPATSARRASRPKIGRKGGESFSQPGAARGLQGERVQGGRGRRQAGLRARRRGLGSTCTPSTSSARRWRGAPLTETCRARSRRSRRRTPRASSRATRPRSSTGPRPNPKAEELRDEDGDDRRRRALQRPRVKLDLPRMRGPENVTLETEVDGSHAPDRGAARDGARPPGGVLPRPRAARRSASSRWAPTCAPGSSRIDRAGARASRARRRTWSSCGARGPAWSSTRAPRSPAPLDA